MARNPVVAGTFYDSEKENLLASLNECFLKPFGPGRLPEAPQNRLGDIVGLVCPHAGYIYSGSAAAHAYAALAEDGLPDTAVLLGPNHGGIGSPIAISPDASWTTPLGTLERNNETTQQILQLCNLASEDNLPHLREHSIEVQLPFLQYIGGTHTKIVPISIAHLNEQDAYLAVSQLAPAIATALQGKKAVIIASTDFSHYETKTRAEAKDSSAIEKILQLDPNALISTVYNEQITMCGVIGTAVMLEAAKLLGATQASKLTYYTSGDITGDLSQVVGYGALCLAK